jgi:hypothetical protein
VYLTAIDATLRRILINTPTINALIATRVYPSYLASVANPTYPCICFSRQPSTRDFRYNKRVSATYDVWIYSTHGYDQTDLVFEYMKNTFDNEWFDLVTVAGRVQYRILDNTSQDQEPDEKLYFGTFRIQAITFFT